jgi:hypothetical protein
MNPTAPGSPSISMLRLPPYCRLHGACPAPVRTTPRISSGRRATRGHRADRLLHALVLRLLTHRSTSEDDEVVVRIPQRCEMDEGGDGQEEEAHHREEDALDR